MKGNIFYAQSGGVTPVINATAFGLIEQFFKNKKYFGKFYAGKNGILGALNEDLIDISSEKRSELKLLKQTPGGAFGSCRLKLKDYVESERQFQRIFEVFKTHNIRYFFYNGGGDSQDTTNKISKFFKTKGYAITCIGLPKTIDNDVFPIKQSLGAWTAAEEGANYFQNIVSEHNANPRMLIVHEVMGRNCGWLTAYTAKVYRDKLNKKSFLSEIGLSKERLDIHGVFIPEMEINIEKEAARLKKTMDDLDNVNIFISEGAGVEAIVKEMEAAGEKIPRDAFGHIKLDAINPGAWFGKQFATLIGAEKCLIQKSGYYSRAAASNEQDLNLIKLYADKAVESALKGNGGVIGQDDDKNDELRAIEFERIAGGKPFDIDADWFDHLLLSIGQEKGSKINVNH